MGVAHSRVGHLLMKIVCISDTHNRHNEIAIPDGDVLVHAGDFTSGDLGSLGSFCEWIHRLPHKYKLLVAGNHDSSFVGPNRYVSIGMIENSGCVYLEDSGIIIDGIKFYGSPWNLKFKKYAFEIDQRFIEEKWDRIPDDTDILITHCPPFGILDKNHSIESIGCPYLLNRIKNMNLMLHVFGHIHEAYGQTSHWNIDFINASCFDRYYKKINDPIWIYV